MQEFNKNKLSLEQLVSGKDSSLEDKLLYADFKRSLNIKSRAKKKKAKKLIAPPVRKSKKSRKGKK